MSQEWRIPLYLLSPTHHHDDPNEYSNGLHSKIENVEDRESPEMRTSKDRRLQKEDLIGSGELTTRREKAARVANSLVLARI